MHARLLVNWTVAWILLGVMPLVSLGGCGSPRRGGSGGGGEEGEGEAEEGEGEGLGEGEGEGGVEGEGEGSAELDLGLDSGLDVGALDQGFPDLGPPPCSPEHPDGFCADPEESCVGGACTPPACSPEHPTGLCPGDETCVEGECLPPPCDAEHPTGRCEEGLICRGGECTAAILTLLQLRLESDGPAEGEPPAPGAANGIPDAGEELALTVEVRNDGPTAYLSLSGTLTSGDPDAAEVVAAAAQQAVADLQPGATGGTEGAFRVRLSPRLPDGAVVPLLLTFQDGRHGELDTLRVRIGVRQGVKLGADQIFVDDSGLGGSLGDNDHLLDPGERIGLQLDLANLGSVALPLPPLGGDLPWPELGQTAVTIALTSNAPFVELPPVAPVAFTGPLAAGGVAQGVAELPVLVDGAAPPDGYYCLTFTFTLAAVEGAPLYVFEEIRCQTLGQGLGGVCRPAPEECNDRDDDCDGAVDEELPQNPCGRCGPTPVEVCDGVDDDCDGQTDDDPLPPADPPCPALGVCQQARPRCDGVDGWACAYPASFEEIESSCDGLDNDCDGQTDERLDPPGGTCPAQGVCREGTPSCGGAQGWRCDLPATHEAGTETRCDGLDNDCDGQLDEGLTPPAGTCPSRGVCTEARAACRGAQGWSCTLPANHEEPETSCDGLDNDCDGRTDEELPAPLNLCPRQGVCQGVAAPVCRGREGWECSWPATYEQVETRCDGLDNDCDGQLDEGLTPPAGTCPIQGVCRDATASCRGAQGWGCNLPATHEANEATCDGLDNDCDGRTDEGLAPPAGQQCLAQGVCAGAVPTCTGGLGWGCTYPPTYEAAEVTCDLLDNDCDGQTDEGCGDTCQNPIRLTFDAAGAVHVEGDTRGAANNYEQSGCMSAKSKDLVYQFNLPQPKTNVVVRMDGRFEQPDEWDTILYLRGGTCDPGTLVACNDDLDGKIGRSGFTIPELGPGDYWLFADGYSAEAGPFDLDIQLGPPPAQPANDTCAAPSQQNLRLATPTVTFSGAVGMARNDLSEGRCMVHEPTMGRDVVYRLNVAERMGVQFTARALDRGPVNLLLVSTACSGAPRQELACERYPGAGQPTTLVAPDLTAGTYWLIVDSETLESHRFEITATTFPPAVAPANETCATATTVVLDAAGIQHATLSGNTQVAQHHYTASCGGADGGDVVFRFRLDQERSIDLRPTTPDFVRPVFSVRRAPCDQAASEVACQAGAAALPIERLAAGDYYLIVDSAAAGQGGPFSFELITYPVLPQAAGSCAEPIPLTATAGQEQQVLGNTRGGGAVLEGECSASAGPERVYSFTVAQPLGPSAFEVRTDRWSTWYSALYLQRSGCGLAGQPIACDTDRQSQLGYSWIEVDYLAPGTYHLVVDGIDAANQGPYRLVSHLGEVQPAPTNENCATAAAHTLVQGEPLLLEGSLGGARDDVSAGTCPLALARAGGDVVYQLTLPAPAMLRLEAVPLDVGGVALRLLSGACSGGAAQEVACQEAQTGPVSRVFPNLAAGTYWLVVSAAAADTDRFELTLETFPAAGANNEKCESAQELVWTAGADRLDHIELLGNAMAASDDLTTSCGGAGLGDLVYRVRLAAESGLVVRLEKPRLGVQAAALYPAAQCELGGGELLCIKTGANPAVAFLPRVPAGEYNLVVDATLGAEAWPFEAHLTRYPPLTAQPANSSCVAPQPLTFDGAGRALVLATTAQAANDHSNDPLVTCGQATGPEQVYRFQLARPRGSSTFRVTSQDLGNWDTFLYLKRGPCAQATVVACDDDEDGRTSSAFTLGQLEAGEYTLYVDGYNQNAKGTYYLQVELGAEL